MQFQGIARGSDGSVDQVMEEATDLWRTKDVRQAGGRQPFRLLIEEEIEQGVLFTRLVRAVVLETAEGFEPPALLPVPLASGFRVQLRDRFVHACLEGELEGTVWVFGCHPSVKRTFRPRK